jgi:hypothetical protein
MSSDDTEFAVAFDDLIDVAKKINKLCKVVGRVDTIGALTEKYDQVWLATRGSDKHVALVRAIGDDLVRKIRGKDDDLLESVFAAVENSKYKIIAMGKSKRKPPSINVSMILTRGMRLAGDYDGPESTYADIFVLDLLKVCKAAECKGMDTAITVLENEIGTGSGTRVVPEESFESIMMNFAKDVAPEQAGQINMSEMTNALKGVMKSNETKETFKSAMGGMKGAKNMQEVFTGLMGKMGNVEVPPDLIASLEATADGFDTDDKATVEVESSDV